MQFVEAENISEKFNPRVKAWTTEFDFLCPNCGVRHAATEMTVAGKTFNTVEYELSCGHVKIRMPWASPTAVTQ